MAPMISRAACLAIALAAFLPPAAAAQDAKPGAPPKTNDIDLSTIKTLTCTFSVSAIGGWKNGEPEGQIRTGGTVTVQLEDIDTQDGSARMGNEDIVLQASTWNLHFLEVARSGRLTMTSVFAQESKPGRLKAVHTRTDYLKISMPKFESEPQAAQYYGDCEVGR
jgi:hypothetical protein